MSIGSTEPGARGGGGRSRLPTPAGTVALVAMLALLATQPAGASAQGASAQAGSASAPSSDDKTGTNPLNIQSTLVVRNEFLALPEDLFSNHSHYRYVTPLARRTMSAHVDIQMVAANVTGRTEAGFGDLGAAWTWIPWLGQSRGILVGVDSSWNTSTNDALGSGRHSFAPFTQLVILPLPTVVVGARYEQRQSFGGDAGRSDISLGTVSLYVAWLPVPGMWIIAEPQVFLDYEHDENSGRVDAEWGRLLFGGVGTYIRPGVGIGSAHARPFDLKVEVGFRVIP